MKHIRHRPDEDGWTEWVRPMGPGMKEQKGYRMSCCDCGLTHEMEFDTEADGKVIFRARRHERATGQVRRWRKKEEEGGD